MYKLQGEIDTLMNEQTENVYIAVHTDLKRSWKEVEVVAKGNYTFSICSSNIFLF